MGVGRGKNNVQWRESLSGGGGGTSMASPQTLEHISKLSMITFTVTYYSGTTLGEMKSDFFLSSC